jgi:hypothetical protein
VLHHFQSDGTAFGRSASDINADWRLPKVGSRYSATELSITCGNTVTK